MKLTVTQENFARGLNTVGSLSSKQVNLPILNNVLMRAEKEGLTLVTTNLEIGITTRVRGKVEEVGDFTVGAKLLNDFVNSLHRENISIVLNQNTLEVKGENHTTKIKGEPAVDFPLIPQISSNLEVVLATSDLRDALSQTIFAASLDESRPELNALFFVFSQKELVIVSTDSYRLSERRIKLTTGTSETRSLIVPVRTMQHVIRIIQQSDAEVTKIHANENQIKFIFDDTELTSRVIEGQYPDYTQIIPKNFTTTISFDAKEFVSAIKTTSLFCQPGINDIKISYVPDTGEMQLRAQNSMAGDNLSKLNATIEGVAGDIIFNYKFVLEGLNNLAASKGFLKLNDPNSPVLLTGQGKDDFVYLIMPIKQ